ncbi:MAG: hypothetical protein ACTSV7_13095, partial [Candidatus Baldrarchaeia archaeon]
MFKTVIFHIKVKNTNCKIFRALLILTVLTGIVALSFANHAADDIIHNTGRIVTEIVAESGSADDIQEAVDLAASLGVGIVRIPEGTFNFVEVGEPWKTVVVPSGISIFGAPTERLSGIPYDGLGMNPNGQVVEWRTVLVMPYDVPSGATWFEVVGDSNPNVPFRFSDIKLVGYRSFNPNSTTKHNGLVINKVINFRVDHCCFEHICGKAIYVRGHYCCGVIDHCILDNPVGTTGLMPEDSTVGYGVQVARAYPEAETEWEEDLTQILGKYLNYTVFIEDCYFTKWRSGIASNRGGFYVVRHCTFEHTVARGEVDIHEAWESMKPNVAGRGTECYNNIFRNPDAHEGWDGALELWAGGGVVFNNYVADYGNFMWIGSGGGWDPSRFSPEYYIWN